MPVHGKYSTYTNYQCRCDDCKQAMREYHDSRRNQSVPELAHGTRQGYTKYYCRCDRCKKAYARYAYDLREKRAQILNPVDLTDKWGTDEMWNQL